MLNRSSYTERGSDADEVGGGHELPIIRTNGECIELDESALKTLLLDERVKDKPMAIVTVAGAFRTGKSFLLGFFLRYLYHLGRAVWLGDEHAPLRGFAWRDGCERHTTGILVWNKVFLVKTSQGEEIAVLLMDTQGMHDDHSTIKESATIFALGTMMSSVLVYNISQNIQESDLQYLQLFVDYARLAQQQRAGKPFQKLLFLVRDWYHLRDAGYGAEGGRTLLKRRLELAHHQPEQLQELRRYIKSSFTDIDCFLLPNPGKKVTTCESFDGRLSDIDEDFKEQLEILIPSLLAPENLTTKKINGQHITCGEFHIYMKAYVDVFNGGELPEPMSVLQATAKANNLAAVFKALKLYTTRMSQLCKGEKISAKRLRRYHDAERENALTMFQNISKMGGDDFSQPYFEKLQKEIDEWFQDFASRVTLKSCLESKRCCMAQLGGSIAMGIGAVASATSGLPVVAVCLGIGAVGIVFSLAWTEFRGCARAPKKDSKIEDRVCVVDVHDELLDGPRTSPDEAARNIRRRQATPARRESGFHTMEVEETESRGSSVRPKGRKRNIFKRLFTRTRRKTHGPTEHDRLKQC